VGVSEKTRQIIIAGVSHTGGGWGAKMTEDGVSATIAMNDGDTHNSPVELMETKYPLVVERYGLVPDSGGAGRWRGGLGCERVVRPLCELRLTSHIDRSQYAPWGLFGGGDALPNRLAVRRGGVVKDDFANAKVFTMPVRQGDAVLLRGGGGGGFGDPLDRPAEMVCEDVYQGYVSLEAARALYGVVIEPEDCTIDRTATEALRARLRRQAEAGSAA